MNPRHVPFLYQPVISQLSVEKLLWLDSILGTQRRRVFSSCPQKPENILDIMLISKTFSISIVLYGCPSPLSYIASLCYTSCEESGALIAVKHQVTETQRWNDLGKASHGYGPGLLAKCSFCWGECIFPALSSWAPCLCNFPVVYFISFRWQIWQALGGIPTLEKLAFGQVLNPTGVRETLGEPLLASTTPPKPYCLSGRKCAYQFCVYQGALTKPN